MKKLVLFLLVFVAIACGNQQTKIIDDVHKTFYVNGVSAIDGYDAIAKSLQSIGFVIDKDGVQELDLTAVGLGFSYYVNYYADDLTKAQASKLTAGLFDDLPSKVIYVDANKWRVYLKWYMSGEVSECTIACGDPRPELLPEDAVEVNKRLSEMFPHSKIGNSRFGYKVYYDDNGVELYFTDSFYFQIEKK